MDLEMDMGSRKGKESTMRGESGWISFVEREMKGIVDWLLRIVCEDSILSDMERACLREIGYKSIWWTRCNHLCEKFSLRELVYLL